MNMPIETRLLDLSPTSYNKELRSVDAVLSKGSPVARAYGTEVLKISRDAIDLSRVFGAGIPVLDSHQQVGLSNALGVVRAAWIEHAALLGTLQFNQTPEGKNAEGMVARKEVNGISIGYRVDDWTISDGEGHAVNPVIDHLRWDDNDLTFTASKWSLLECSLCNIPADDHAGIRAFGDRAYVPFYRANANVRARMRMRQNMHAQKWALRHTPNA